MRKVCIARKAVSFRPFALKGLNLQLTRTKAASKPSKAPKPCLKPRRSLRSCRPHLPNFPSIRLAVSNYSRIVVVLLVLCAKLEATVVVIKVVEVVFVLAVAEEVAAVGVAQ